MIVVYIIELLKYREVKIMEFIHVMIVDDDKIIIKYLINLIDWKAHDFEIVATAYNGKAGVSLYQEKKPHIILTDIKMPIMDGLEMIQDIKNSNTEVEFLILSSYGEFEYAQEAILLGASAYTLKTELNPSSLLKILLPIKDKLITKTENTFLTICNIVHSFVEGKTHPDLSNSLIDLEKTFKHYMEGVPNWGLQALAERLCGQIKKAYKNHGCVEFFKEKDFYTKNELYDWLKDQFAIIDRWIVEKESNEISPIISKAILYIENHQHNKNLNIKSLAYDLAISPSWLSICFKKETGFTVKEYVKRVRIESAKELLQQGNYKVYEVADMVGFNSSQYFSKVFYNATKQLPQHYRRDTNL